MTKTALLEMAKEGIAHAQAGTLRQADSIYSVPAQNYHNPQRWQLEMERVFKRMPLMLAFSAELPEPGDYKAMNAAGTPVLIVRNQQGEIGAFVNSCAHRGAQIVPEGKGNARRFTCPYHAWSYNDEGALTHVYCPQDFGDIDKSQHGLVPLKSLERSGLIWVLNDSRSPLEIEVFLSGYDQQLAHFGLENWHYFDSRVIRGPNWKIAYDGYLDFYHLPVLHKDTFGADTTNKALYYSWGPHQRVLAPQEMLDNLGSLDEPDWPLPYLLTGVWTIFPHISIASFDEDSCRGVLVSQLFPGDSPGESITIQNYLLEKKPDAAQSEKAQLQFDFLRNVVENEDYATGLRQQQALLSGAREFVLFGRNEEGGQRFHQWLERILLTQDEDLNNLFSGRERKGS
jgi:nitrite reductase/ring-hydroxylating ferredoxin subunit